MRPTESEEQEEAQTAHRVLERHIHGARERHIEETARARELRHRRRDFWILVALALLAFATDALTH